MKRIVVRHLSGSKANQEDTFPLEQFKEITLGRDPSSSVKFSQEAEGMVGRRHARITRNPALTSLFLITDLGSRNGTFVNGQRIFGTASLKPGDVVQCGTGGPEFRFDVEPETDSSIASSGASSGETAAPTNAANDEWSTPQAEAGARKRVIVGVGVLIGLFALVVGYVAYGKLRLNNLAEAQKIAAAPLPIASPNASPDATAEKYGHVHPSGGAAEAEKDAQRAAWRIEVAPYLTLGSGRPGNAASDFDKPASVAFSPAGSLFAIDGGNRRVQIWDVKTGSRLAEFGHDVFGGEISGIAIAPNNRILITDQASGLAYDFIPPLSGAVNSPGKPLAPDDYQFKGMRFGEQGFTKLGPVTIDSKGRVYTVDALRNDVLRFNPDGSPDETWKFEKSRADGDTYLRGCEAIAIDEAGGNLFLASEQDAVVELFDWETGAHKNRIVGAGKDASGKPSGKRVFFGAIRGLTVANQRLLAVDESAGHIQIFDLARPDAFDTDLASYAEPQPIRARGYQGFFGHAPLFDFEDKTNTELQRQVNDGSIIPGQANPPGHFCSPGSIASHTDRASGETYIAIADQCNYRIVVYRWSDIAKALGTAETPTGATIAAKKAEAVKKTAPVAAGKTASAIKSKMAPRRARITSANRTGKVTSARGKPGKGISGGKVTSSSAGKGAAVTPSGKNEQKANDITESTVSGKKAKKAKKEKKVKY